MTDTREFNKWFSETFADADGRFAHMPRWLKADLRKAWNEASKRSAAEIERLTRELAEAKRASEYANDCFNEASAKLAAAKSSLSEAVKAAYEDAAKQVPTNWLDPLLTGDGVKRTPLGEREIEALLRGIQDRIRASAIRSRAAVLDSGRGSTQKERSE